MTSQGRAAESLARASQRKRVPSEGFSKTMAANSAVMTPHQASQRKMAERAIVVVVAVVLITLKKGAGWGQMGGKCRGSRSEQHIQCPWVHRVRSQNVKESNRKEEEEEFLSPPPPPLLLLLFLSILFFEYNLRYNSALPFLVFLLLMGLKQLHRPGHVKGPNTSQTNVFSFWVAGPLCTTFMPYFGFWSLNINTNTFVPLLFPSFSLPGAPFFLASSGVHRLAIDFP